MILMLLAYVVCALPAQAEVRLKDITSIRGLRDNQLVGYGLIVGLTGTGDSLRNAPFTDQAMQSMLDHVGVNVRGASLRARNVAGVMVTADLPAGAARGSRVASVARLICPLVRAHDTPAACSRARRRSPTASPTVRPTG